VRPTYTVTRAGTAEATRSLDAYIDECVATRSLSPQGCPMSAEHERLLNDLDVDDVTWTLVNYPEPYFRARPDGSLELLVRKPGTATMTGMAVPDDADGATPTPITVTCEFGFGNLN